MLKDIFRKILRKLYVHYTIFRNAVIDLVKHDGVEHAGYLSFLSILSFFPFLLFLVSIAGIIGESDLGIQFVNMFLKGVPEHVASALGPRVEEIISGPPQSLLSIAIIGIIWTASSAIEGLRTTLNRAYRVDTPPAYILRRTLSILQFVIITFIIMSIVFLVTVIPVVWNKVSLLLGYGFDSLIEWTYVRYVIVTSALLFLISFIYYIIPNVKQRLIYVAPGAILTVIGWIFAGRGFSFYLTHFNQINLVYGSLGGIIIALMFLYVAALIFIFGAEYNYQIGRLYNIKITTRENKKEITKESDAIEKVEMEK